MISGHFVSLAGVAGTAGGRSELEKIVSSIEETEGLLHRVSVLAAELAPAGTSAGISLALSSRPTTVASTHALVPVVDEIQYSLGDGPCVVAMSTGRDQHVRETLDEPRWPGLAREVFLRGIRSILSLPVAGSAGTVGALNLYADRPDAFTTGALDRMRALADVAAGAVGMSVSLDEQTRQAVNLRQALTNRAVVDQAIGILVARNRCTAPTAMALLRSASQRRNIKLRELAARIVEAVADGHPPPVHLSERRRGSS